LLKKLEKVVEQNLNTTKQMFLQSIKVIDTGRMMGRVLIDYSGNKLIQKIQWRPPLTNTN